MKLLNEGKTKDVYELDDGMGNILMKFKDTVTGHADGTIDPGGNQVVGASIGIGKATVAMSEYYFEQLELEGIPTHLLKTDVDKNEMIVKKAEVVGDGLEFIKRYRATGSLRRRFKGYFEEGQEIDITEITVKDDAMDDPPITPEILVEATVLSDEDVTEILTLFEAACIFINEDLAGIGLELWDIKLEFGWILTNDLGDGFWALIDEVGPGNMRVYRNGEKLDKLELAELVLATR